MVLVKEFLLYCERQLEKFVETFRSLKTPQRKTLLRTQDDKCWKLSKIWLFNNIICATHYAVHLFACWQNNIRKLWLQKASVLMSLVIVLCHVLTLRATALSLHSTLVGILSLKNWKHGVVKLFVGIVVIFAYL